jgi:ribonuclease E
MHDGAHELTAEHGAAHDTDDDGADEGEQPGVAAGTHEHGPEHEGAENGNSENGEGGEGRRRRRRGRRGGRRNRRGREGGEAPHFAAEAEPFEPEVGRAAADFDSAPPQREHTDQEPAAPADETPYRAPAPPPEPQPAAYQAPAEPAHEPHHAEAADSPRRRSTVRERAPFGGDAGSEVTPGAASEAPTPAITVVSPEKADEANQPRRAGWWSRRFAGGDKS